MGIHLHRLYRELAGLGLGAYKVARTETRSTSRRMFCTGELALREKMRFTGLIFLRGAYGYESPDGLYNERIFSNAICSLSYALTHGTSSIYNILLHLLIVIHGLEDARPNFTRHITAC